MKGVPLYVELPYSKLGVADIEARDYATYEKDIILLLENVYSEVNVGVDFNEGDVLRLKCLTSEITNVEVSYTTISDNIHHVTIPNSGDTYSYLDIFVGSFIKKLSVNERVSVYKVVLGSVQDLKNEKDELSSIRIHTWEAND